MYHLLLSIEGSKSNLMKRDARCKVTTDSVFPNYWTWILLLALSNRWKRNHCERMRTDPNKRNWLGCSFIWCIIYNFNFNVRNTTMRKTPIFILKYVVHTVNTVYSDMSLIAMISHHSFQRNAQEQKQSPVFRYFGKWLTSIW